MKIRTEKELGEALKKGQEQREIEGDLAKKVIKIKVTGHVAWAVAIGAIAISVAALIATPATSGASNLAHFVTAPAAVAILGVSTTSSAIAIAVATGGIGVLKKLRRYSLKKNFDGSITLIK